MEDNTPPAVQAAQAPAQPPEVQLEHVGNCGTVIIASAQSMMEPLVSLLGFAQAKSLLDQIVKVTDEAVGKAAGAVKKKQLEQFAPDAKRIQAVH